MGLDEAPGRTTGGRSLRPGSKANPLSTRKVHLRPTMATELTWRPTAPRPNRRQQGRGHSPSLLLRGPAKDTLCQALPRRVTSRDAKDRSPSKVGSSARVEKEMSQDAPRRIARLGVRIVIPLPPDHPERKVLEAAGVGCPVHRSLHPDVVKDVTFSWSG